ncbi:battenin isoform X2 [Octopus bimaculoides]|uniref:battenin isoform X2 n=1 Tax=Octopus bimaculoides TaxID=37653 RepID=UPI00071CA8E2|nr:battenin isoform X2 [Octopus bimaculoides]|eukprot:XP_014786537.1 PREDICTED: battenin-like isoform X2 [Octopus bimaculoides]
MINSKQDQVNAEDSTYLLPSEHSSGTMQNNSQCSLDSMKHEEKENKRNLLAFWIFGLCNNFAYVIMLSAAHDILKEEENKKQNQSDTFQNNSSTFGNTTADSGSKYLICNEIGTGAILLADILPALLIKLSSPLYIQKLSYNLKVTIIIATTTLSFILVSAASNVIFSIIGVCFASFSSGLGEVTFLSLTSFFHKNVVSTWSSGTGGAGIFGALSYAGLTMLNLSPRHTILVMLIIPAIFAFSYFVLLQKPPVLQTLGTDVSHSMLLNSSPPRLMLNTREKLVRIGAVVKYMLPLCLVYIAEYYINQTLFELLYFNKIWLKSAEQYRWYQVDYQIGVFIARSSVNLFHLKFLWLPVILQMGILAILQTQVLFHYIKSFWIIIAVIFIEGVQGGLAYVNTYYRMSQEISPEYLEFSIGVTCVADSMGIAIAGLISIPAHNSICRRPIKM